MTGAGRQCMGARCVLSLTCGAVRHRFNGILTLAESFPLARPDG